MSDSKPTLDQRRAQHAWNAVQRAKAAKDPKKFGNQAKKLPTRIMAAGLGQALAFLWSKGYAPELLKELGDWVLHRVSPSKAKPSSDEKALMEAIVEGNADFLRRATDETLAYLEWLNRFSEAEGLTDEANGD